MSKAVVVSFLVQPFVPKDVGALYDRDGQPAFTDYDKVDWAGLAKAIKDDLASVVPGNVKIYIGNDGPDSLDATNINVAAQAVEQSRGTYYTRTQSALALTQMADYRAGVANLRQHDELIHLNPTMDSTRSPLAAFVMSVKFTDKMQFADYSSNVLNRLFCVHTLPQLSTDNLEEVELPMPKYIHEWLEAQFGAVYGNSCIVEVIHSIEQ